MVDPRQALPSLPLPLLRGRLHQYAAGVAAIAAVVLIALAPDERARTAAAIYGAGLCVLFGMSAL